MVNGIPSSCQSRDCSFIFSENDTARLSHVKPPMGGQDGSPIRITGTGFPSDKDLVNVTIDDEICTIQTISDSYIECVPPQHEAGVYTIQVLVSGIGFALPPTDKNNLTFEYSIVVNDFQANSGSVFGGNLVKFQGAGFPHLSKETIRNYSTNQYGRFFHPSVYVLFDDLPCFIKSSNLTTLTCIPQAHVEDTVNVTLSVNGVQLELPNAYTYSVNETMLVDSISPSGSKVTGGDNITLYGRNFESDVTVVIGDSRCDVVSVSRDRVVCTTSPHRPGQFPVVIDSLISGEAIHSSFLSSDELTSHQIPFNAFFDIDHTEQPMNMSYLSAIYPMYTYELMVTSVTPPTGSLAGGTEVTITGIGFDETTVVMATLTGQQCEISHVSYEEIKCVMPTSEKIETIKNTGVHQGMKL